MLNGKHHSNSIGTTKHLFLIKVNISDKLIIKNLNFLPKNEKNIKIKLLKLICYSLCQDFILPAKFATYILYSCAKFHKKSKPVTLSF